MFDINPNVVVFLIPIIAILGGFTVAIVGIIMEGKKEELKRKERLIAMEKGIPLPPEPSKESAPRPRRSRHVAARGWGFVLTFLGIALIVSISLASDRGLRDGTWGFLVLAVGLGLLVAASLEKRESEAEKRQ